ncbi:MAG: hypothetical protein Q9190_002420 [Brigantiaea leucoxantha]
MAGFMYTLKGKHPLVLSILLFFISQPLTACIVSTALPSCYDKDMQEGTSYILNTMHTTTDSIQILNGVLTTLSIDPVAMHKSLEPSMLATELADYLVRRNVPFRETHHISGQLVKLASDEKKHINELTLEEMRKVDSRFDGDVEGCFDYEAAVERRTAKGGTSKECVIEQILVLEHMLESPQKELKAW